MCWAPRGFKNDGGFKNYLEGSIVYKGPTNQGLFPKLEFEAWKKAGVPEASLTWPWIFTSILIFQEIVLKAK